MVPRTRIELVRSGEGPQDFKSEGKNGEKSHNSIISRYLSRLSVGPISPYIATNQLVFPKVWEKYGAKKTNILLVFGSIKWSKNGHFSVAV